MAIKVTLSTDTASIVLSSNFIPPTFVNEDDIPSAPSSPITNNSSRKCKSRRVIDPLTARSLEVKSTKIGWNEPASTQFSFSIPSVFSQVLNEEELLDEIIQTEEQVESFEDTSLWFMNNNNIRDVKLLPEYCFSRIARSARRLIRMKSDNLPYWIISSFEEVAIEVIEAAKETSLFIENPFHRLLLHSVCQFYGLNSSSEDILTNLVWNRRTVITRPNNFCGKLPVMRFCEFLQQQQQHQHQYRHRQQYFYKDYQIS